MSRSTFQASWKGLRLLRRRESNCVPSQSLPSAKTGHSSQRYMLRQCVEWMEAAAALGLGLMRSGDGRSTDSAAVWRKKERKKERAGCQRGNMKRHVAERWMHASEARRPATTYNSLPASSMCLRHYSCLCNNACCVFACVFACCV